MNPALLAASATFAFTSAVVFGYRILPVEGTPHWLFTLFFLINAVSVGFAYMRPGEAWGKSRGFVLLFLAAVTVSLFGALYTSIVDRGQNAPGQAGGVHDIVLQLEQAVKFLGDGINPYRATYFGTPLEDFHYEENGVQAVNPALYHFVMPPWYLVFSYPFYYMSMRTFGFFDGRMPLLFMGSGIVAILLVWFRSRPLAALAVLFVLFAPAQVTYFMEGRSDMFVLFFLLLSLVLLDRKHFSLSVAVMAIAVLTKQTAWFAVPLYAVALSLRTGISRIESVRKYTPVFIAVLLAVAGPFILWDPAALIDSTILYVSGNTAGSYPVSGYGLGMLLHEAGIIRNIHDSHPFILWQAIIGLPVFLLGLKIIREKKTTSSFLMAYGLLLFAVWYSSRYFNNSHAVFIASILVLSSLKSWDEKGV
jgi:hypothetical protein